MGHKKKSAKLSKKIIKTLYEYDDLGINPFIVLEYLKICFHKSHHKKYEDQSFRIIPNESRILTINDVNDLEEIKVVHTVAMKYLYDSKMAIGKRRDEEEKIKKDEELY